MTTLYCQKCDTEYECGPIFWPFLCWCGGKHFTNDPSLRGLHGNEMERWLLLTSEALEGTW